MKLTKLFKFVHSIHIVNSTRVKIEPVRSYSLRFDVRYPGLPGVLHYSRLGQPGGAAGVDVEQLVSEAQPVCDCLWHWDVRLVFHLFVQELSPGHSDAIHHLARGVQPDATAQVRLYVSHSWKTLTIDFIIS